MAMLTLKVLAERTAAQCSRSASSGDALDVRWARARTTLVPPGSPAVVAEHLASRLAVRPPALFHVSISQNDNDLNLDNWCLACQLLLSAAVTAAVESDARHHCCGPGGGYIIWFCLTGGSQRACGIQRHGGSACCCPAAAEGCSFPWREHAVCQLCCQVERSHP